MNDKQRGLPRGGREARFQLIDPDGEVVMTSDTLGSNELATSILGRMAQYGGRKAGYTTNTVWRSTSPGRS